MNVYLSFSKLDFAKDDELEGDEPEGGTEFRPVFVKREEFTFFSRKVHPVRCVHSSKTSSRVRKRG
jgi:hypothetical protein